MRSSVVPAATLRRLTSALFVLVALLLVAAGPATAHADLKSTTPAAGSEVAIEPAMVVLTFSEAVSVPARAIVVLDAAANRVDTGEVTHPAGDTSAAAVGLRPGLPEASYLVVWHVISDDGHPVSGNFTFGVGVPAGPPPSAPPSTPDTALDIAHWLGQFLTFVGALALAGAVAFVLVLWPGGRGSTATERVVTTAWVTASVGSLILLVSGPAYGSGGSLWDAVRGSDLAAVLRTTEGRLDVLRVLVLLMGALAWRRAARAGRPMGRLDAVALWLLLVESFSFAGHAGHSSSPLLTTSVDALHLTAAGTWFGGLVVLSAVLQRQPARVAVAVGSTVGAPARPREPENAHRPEDHLAGVLPRWSTLATASVATIAATGVFAATRDVGSWGALWATTYGRLVVVKVLLFAVVLLVAAISHRTVRRWAPTATASSRLRRLVVTEAVLVSVIVGATAALVATAPAVDTYRPTFTTTLTGTEPTGGSVVLHVLIRPTTPGFEGLTVHASATSGEEVPIVEATMSFINRETGIGPIEFPATVTPGKGVEDTLISVPGPGRWDVSMQLLIGTQWYSARTSYDVG